MSTVDDLTNLAGVVVTAGVVSKLVDATLPKQQVKLKRAVKSHKKTHKKIKGLGDFSNAGF